MFTPAPKDPAAFEPRDERNHHKKISAEAVPLRMREFIGEAKFKKLVEEGIRAIPEKFLKKLDNVAIVIEEAPAAQQLKAARVGRDRTLLGLYQGIPKTKRWNYGGGVLPDKITIFRKPILDEADSEEEVRQIVCGTVWHEIAHHFGMDEDEVGRRETRRRGA